MGRIKTLEERMAKRRLIKMSKKRKGMTKVDLNEELSKRWGKKPPPEKEFLPDAPGTSLSIPEDFDPTEGIEDLMDLP